MEPGPKGRVKAMEAAVTREEGLGFETEELPEVEASA
jgi:hypothetical protein